MNASDSLLFTTHNAGVAGSSPAPAIKNHGIKSQHRKRSLALRGGVCRFGRSWPIVSFYRFLQIWRSRFGRQAIARARCSPRLPTGLMSAPHSSGSSTPSVERRRCIGQTDRSRCWAPQTRSTAKACCPDSLFRSRRCLTEQRELESRERRRTLVDPGQCLLLDAHGHHRKMRKARP